MTKAMPTRPPVKLPIPPLKRPMSYAVGLAFVASLAACGGSSAGSADATSAAVSTMEAPTQVPTQVPTQAPTQKKSDKMVITITGRKVDPAPATVRLAVGQSLTLVITSDHDDTLHAHGFDVEKALVAGQPTTVTLTGRTPGSYEVETHDPELRLLVVDVQ